MDSKIFLGKYRVSAGEIGAAGELHDGPLAYEGEEVDSGKKVIVEVVPTAALKPAMREKLEAKAKAAKKLNHVNIPALYDFGIEGDHLVYVTEDFEGTLAEEWVNAHGPMPVGPVLRIAAQVVSAMGAAAFQRISHHAINPSNLVLVPGQTTEGEWPLIKVLHFVGAAPKFSESDVSVAAFDKALHYASPEQFQNGVVDFRSEIYSLGCTMWFLLTGAPPRTTPHGPMAEPLTQTGLAQTGLALDKISGLPKEIRRLLAQMLSLNPEARPRDPLAFYRALQDCLALVERRETMARGSVSTRALDPPGRGRRPMKTLALAAMLLAAAALAALVLTGYRRHLRVVQAEEPIGVPIGVPEAPASATPVTADAANAMTSNATPPTAVAVADSNRTQSEPPGSSDNSSGPPVATDSVEDAATNQVVVVHMQPTTPDSAVNPPTQGPAADPANNATTVPSVSDSPEVAVTSQVEAAPTPTASPDRGEVREIDREAAPKKIIMREVRRAELVEEPEVRRAEPAPPEEGPADVAPEATASPAEKTKANQAAPPSSAVKRTNSKPAVPAKPPEKTSEPIVKPPRRANEIIYRPRPAR